MHKCVYMHLIARFHVQNNKERLYEKDFYTQPNVVFRSSSGADYCARATSDY